MHSLTHSQHSFRNFPSDSTNLEEVAARNVNRKGKRFFWRFVRWHEDVVVLIFISPPLLSPHLTSPPLTPPLLTPSFLFSPLQLIDISRLLSSNRILSPCHPHRFRDIAHRSSCRQVIRHPLDAIHHQPSTSIAGPYLPSYNRFRFVLVSACGVGMGWDGMGYTEMR
ncbi:hypothetical protein SCHPADRAFT_617081 [Schizopora paradoxa]|uniref:Uncharacterized protein n=1 Tax=Schizopora paradoxa TaxID=27342 RepID=A0A0H2RF69_9AGAM|nr:hypothetical protein SCHPADRAFT_617081 [Schizopora paradoxa]